ncbi:hypothetical protein PInf_019017 [Phytophthora infestans]|nr:hypothetical protein PInf_019017 [Phytophthora infestans]
MARTPLTLGQRKGRTRISGTGKPPKKFKRVAISYAYKLSVVEFYDAVVSKDKMHLIVKYFYDADQTDRQLIHFELRKTLLFNMALEINCGDNYVRAGGTVN